MYSMFNGIGNGLDIILKTWAIMLIVFVPLGLWKMVEIIVWITTHVKIDIG